MIVFKPIQSIIRVIEAILNFRLLRKALYPLSMLFQLGTLKKDFYLSNDVMNEMFDSAANSIGSTSLDIGSGRNPRNPFSARDCLRG